MDAIETDPHYAVRPPWPGPVRLRVLKAGVGRSGGTAVLPSWLRSSSQSEGHRHSMDLRLRIRRRRQVRNAWIVHSRFPAEAEVPI